MCERVWIVEHTSAQRKYTSICRAPDRGRGCVGERNDPDSSVAVGRSKRVEVRVRVIFVCICAPFSCTLEECVCVSVRVGERSVVEPGVQQRSELRTAASSEG